MNSVLYPLTYQIPIKSIVHPFTKLNYNEFDMLEYLVTISVRVHV